MMQQSRTLVGGLCALAFCCLCLFVPVSDGAAADVSSCPEALTKLLPCLPFAQGTAQVPAKDCCSNLLTIHETKPQCLCALIAASVNGTAGLPKMNTTLSLELGPACNVATKPARCPALLGLSPDDPLNKIFTNGTAASNSTTSPSSQSGAGGAAAPTAQPPASSQATTLIRSFLASSIVAALSVVLC